MSKKEYIKNPEYKKWHDIIGFLYDASGEIWEIVDGDEDKTIKELNEELTLVAHLIYQVRDEIENHRDTFPKLILGDKK